MKYNLNVQIQGETKDDLIYALKEVVEKVNNDYTLSHCLLGHEGYEYGSYKFEIIED